MDGIFDWIRRALPGFEAFRPPAETPGLPAPEARPGLPAPPPSGGLIPRPERLPMFEALRPKEGEGLLVRYLPPKTIFAPLAPPEAPPQEPPQQPSLWPALFAGEEPQATVPEMFSFAAPQEAPPEEALYEPAELRWLPGEPVPLWRVSSPWRMPTTMELVDRIREKWDLLELWDFVLLQTDYPAWREMVADSAHTGEAARLEIDLVAEYGDPYDSLSQLLGVPESVPVLYFRDARNNVEAEAAGELYYSEVIGPMLDRFSKAFDVLKPVSLRGWFDISPGMDGDWWFSYNQAAYR